MRVSFRMVGACRLLSLWLGTGERTGDHDVGVNGCVLRDVGTRSSVAVGAVGV
jgi:hypothetical protein